MTANVQDKVTWLLRIGVCMIFVGHGAVALGVNPSWIKYITTMGFSIDSAKAIMPFIGVVDILVGISVLIHPLRPVLIWATFWAFSAALIRPISGEPVWSFVERGGNWIIPLCLLIILTIEKSSK